MILYQAHIWPDSVEFTIGTSSAIEASQFQSQLAEQQKCYPIRPGKVVEAFSFKGKSTGKGEQNAFTLIRESEKTMNMVRKDTDPPQQLVWYITRFLEKITRRLLQLWHTPDVRFHDPETRIFTLGFESQPARTLHPYPKPPLPLSTLLKRWAKISTQTKLQSAGNSIWCGIYSTATSQYILKKPVSIKARALQMRGSTA